MGATGTDALRSQVSKIKDTDLVSEFVLVVGRVACAIVRGVIPGGFLAISSYLVTGLGILSPENSGVLQHIVSLIVALGLPFVWGGDFQRGKTNHDGRRASRA